MNSGTSLTTNDRAIIVIGDPGTRKTTLCLHFPSPYFIDCDGNLSAPVEQTGIREFFYDRATHKDDGTLVHPLNRYWHCIECLNHAVIDPNIKTIIIDSLTTFTDIIVNEIKRKEFGLVAVTDKAKDDAQNTTMRIQDWGTFYMMITDFITKMRGCGKLFVLIAHTNFDKDKVDQRFKQFINVPGKSKNCLSGFFTDCWHTYMTVTGIGAAVKHEFLVRTLPVSESDHRGVKSSFKNLKRVNTFDEVIAEIKKL